MTGSEKRSWQRPELVVLTRSRPEETVLAACKGALTQGPATVHGNSCSIKGAPCYTKTLS
jgi:hypothetical protein